MKGFFFFLKSPKAILTQLFWANFLFPRKQVANFFLFLVLGLWRESEGGWGEPVATGLCTGYACNGPVQNCRQ